MWGVEFPSDEALAYSLIGVQYKGPTPPAQKAARIAALDALLKSSDSGAAHTDDLVQQGHGAQADWHTRLWLSYWPTATAYDAWARQPAVASFWRGLPAADAGVYREVLRVSPRRAQLGTNKDQDAGLRHLGRPKPLGEKAMYWGCYRDRYADTAAGHALASPLAGSAPEPRGRPGTGTGPARIRAGRTRVTRFPDHLCFVVEGQDHAALSPDEKDHWFQHFDGAVTTWMQDLLAAGPDDGLLDAKICYAPDSGRYHSNNNDNDQDDDDVVTALHYNKKVQLFWFLDHRHMEKLGRSNKGHAALRQRFIQSYCPAGPMGAHGKLRLWVETSVLKADEIEAEYVGVVEGTGFLAYDHHPAFASTREADVSRRRRTAGVGGCRVQRVS